uniref:DUS-like FMN-binding domain-containing protein n=1 Tax=Meleagris gallopavo TaxID=9103 RepID=A0A803YK30_MELGA
MRRMSALWLCCPCPRRLAFRTLVRRYGCELCYTPMVVAADFVRSAKARDSEFTTNRGNGGKYIAAFLECFMY